MKEGARQGGGTVEVDDLGKGGRGEVAVEAVVDGQVQEPLLLPLKSRHLQQARTPPRPADAGGNENPSAGEKGETREGDAVRAAGSSSLNYFRTSLFSWAGPRYGP